MEFCDACNNMLYIKNDDDDSRNVKYYCKNCTFEKDITIDNKSKLIIQNTFDVSNQLLTNLNSNIEYDKTIPHVDNIQCPYKDCVKKEEDKNDVMYIKTDINNIKFIYYCTYCKQFWENK